MDRHFFEAHGVVQLDGETEKAFRAFRTYLQSPPRERSQRKCVEEGFAKGTVQRWSSQHKWQERARAFDAVMAEEAFSELIAQRKGLIVASLNDSLEDAAVLRAKIMHAAERTSKSLEVSQLVTARVEVDLWMAQIVGTVNRLGEPHAETTD